MFNKDLKSESDVKREYPFLSKTINKEFAHLSEEDRLKIAQLVTGVCGSCNDAPLSCKCWNDD